MKDSIQPTGYFGTFMSSIRSMPPAERPAWRRKRIIAAAIEIYGEAGFRNATVRAICRRAELTERYFYESFSSSEQLLLETARVLAQRTLTWLRHVRDEAAGDAETRTRLLLRAYFMEQLEQRSHARLFTLEFRGLSPEADEEFDRILNAFADLIIETRRSNARVATPSRLIRHGLIGGILQLTTAWIEGGYREPVEEVVAAALRFCRVLDT